MSFTNKRTGKAKQVQCLNPDDTVFIKSIARQVHFVQSFPHPILHCTNHKIPINHLQMVLVSSTNTTPNSHMVAENWKFKFKCEFPEPDTGAAALCCAHSFEVREELGFLPEFPPCTSRPCIHKSVPSYDYLEYII